MIKQALKLAQIYRFSMEEAKMQQGNENVEGGAAVVALSGEAFRSVAGHITELAHQIRRASEAVTEVNTTKDSMVASLKRVEEITKSAAEETQNVSAATEQQAAGMEEIAASSRGLSDMAHDLNAAAAKFKT